MDLSDMLLGEPPVKARAGGKFLPRAKQRPRKEASASVAAADKGVTESASVAAAEKGVTASAAPEKQDFPECNNDPGIDACSDMAEKNLASGSFSHDYAEKLAMRDAGANAKFEAQPDTGPIKENYGSQPSSVPGDLSEKNTTMSVISDTGHGPELSHIVNDSENLGVSPSQQGVHSKQTKVDGSNDSHLTLAKSAAKSAGILLGLECCDQLLVQSSNITGSVDKATCTIGMAGQPENMDIRLELMKFDAASGTGRRVGKFKPKPSRKGVSDHLEGGSVPVLSSDDILGHPSMDTANSVSLDPSTSEQPMSEDMMNALETSNSHDAPSEEASKMPEVEGSDSMKLNSHGTFNPSSKSTSSSAPDEDQRVRRSSRKPRKRPLVPHVDDEPEEDTYTEGSPASDPPTTAADDVVEDISLKKGNRRKTKNAVAKRKKSVRKSKKVSEASDEQAEETPKKFPHATLRKRRLDQTLIETPEEEYDRLPMKDLILLAEYKERLAKKEAKASNVSVSSASQNPFNEVDAHIEDGFNEVEHQQGSGDDQTGQVVQTSSSFFNYQSFMKKEPRVKWSKEETELFYEAIQQFGSDFSMIQQLFPGRSRRQMKAKYRLEERKHPLRMSEASETRAKDLSHFERLAQELQQAGAAKSEHDIAEDDSEDMAGKEDGPTPETNAKVAGDRDVEDQGADAAKEGKVDGSDYGDDDMCTYESAF